MMYRVAIAWACWATLVTMPGVVVAAEEYKSDPGYKPTRDLSQFFAKVKAGRSVTVMGIGGSVTEGHSWAAMSAEWLQKQYPNTHIHYVDGAFGGTGPDAVVFRFRRDILPHHPDLVFIEYTVNSYAKHDINFKALDGMVLQLLRQWQKPDIVFVYVGNDKGERDLSKVQPLARHYGFQEVDPRKHLQTLIDAGKVRWQDIARDRIHPNEKGHAIYAEPLIQLLKQQAALADRPTPVPPVPPPYASEEWAHAALVPVVAAHYGNQWKAVKPSPWGERFWDEMIESDQVGATVTFTANSTTIGAYLLIANDCGNIAWSIDGGKETELMLANWGTVQGGMWASNSIFASDLPAGEHTLKITVKPKWEKSTGNFVRIGGFCVANPKPAAK
jgi:lysophospholipase L1-like esterase